MTWLVDDALQPGADMSLARMLVRPGFVTEAHRHPNCSAAIHVIAGEVDWTIGAEVVRLRAGDTAFVPTATAHFARNPSRQMRPC
jgi:mannose-6-phosphate isomerase-like protein (cupin superfamily)